MKQARSSNFLVLLTLAIVFTPASAMAARILVSPGESIQAAVDAASPGDKIVVLPGTYQETHGGSAAVRVNKPLKMIARVTRKQLLQGEKVVIIPGPGHTDGILVEPDPGAPDVDGVVIRGFTVQGFSNNGIYLRYVQNFKIEKNQSIDNLENGIFPTLSANGLVKRNLSYGSADSALWVEASENVRVLRNIFHSSVTGLEITVSNNVQVKGNEVFNNVVGLGLYHPSGASLPPLAVMDNWYIANNYIHDNNLPNFAPPGSMPASLPPGGGILVNGTDGAKVVNNRIENNDFYGIAVLDWCVAVDGGPFNCVDNPPEVEPYPDNNRFVRNTLINNGTNPVAHPLAILAADLIYLVFERDHYNCFAKNKYTTQSFQVGAQPDWTSGRCS